VAATQHPGPGAPWSATVEESLRSDLKPEEKGLGDMREGVAHCGFARHDASRDLLRCILADEEEHTASDIHRSACRPDLQCTDGMDPAHRTGVSSE
jgi:Ferritin-like domain